MKNSDFKKRIIQERTYVNYDNTTKTFFYAHIEYNGIVLEDFVEPKQYYNPAKYLAWYFEIEENRRDKNERKY